MTADATFAPAAADRWHEAEHVLRFGRPLPGGAVELRWRGAALMGVVNVTPDSFSDGGAFEHPRDAVAAGLRLVEQGALVVDVGGESTRPGAAPVDDDEEMGRVLPVVAGLVAEGVVVSVDTRKPRVAEAALAEGAALVNDVAGLRDARMVEVCANAGAPAVVMHMLGDPRTMQADPRYHDVVADVTGYLLAAAERALAAGVPSVVLDVGLGFGKTVEHNLALLNATGALAAHGHPVLVGASRKSFLGRVAGVERPADRLGATLAAHLHAARLGAALLRVHDVEPHRQALAVAAALEGRA